MEWLDARHDGGSTSYYVGTQSPHGKSDLWHKVAITGNWVRAADESHQRSHHSQVLEVFHGTSPNALVQILKYGGMKDGSVHVGQSHTPWCCMGCDTFSKATENSLGQQGCLVHLVVHGQRHRYGTVQKRADLADIGLRKDWRAEFLDREPGRTITSRGTIYMKANATELQGFFVRDDKLAELARMSYQRLRGRR